MARDIGKWLVALALSVICLPGTGLAIGVGDTAPDFTLTDLHGAPHALSSYSSHPVLLVFLSCTDGTSRSVTPLVQTDLYDAYSSDGLTVLGVECLGGNAEQMTQFWHDTGVDFPLLMDGETVRAAYGIDVLGLVLVDAGGMVRYVSSGQGGQAYDRNALIGIVERTLAETNSSIQATWGLIKGLYVD
jgi:peroxiredoxin